MHKFLTLFSQTIPPGLPWWLSWRRIHVQCGKPGFDPWVSKISCRREQLCTPVFWPGEFHRLYSPWGHKELDMTECLSLSRFLPHNPKVCSLPLCLFCCLAYRIIVSKFHIYAVIYCIGVSLSDLLHSVCCCCCEVASVILDSVRPHRRQPTRLSRPWDSPGKNTGVGNRLQFHPPH